MICMHRLHEFEYELYLHPLTGNNDMAHHKSALKRIRSDRKKATQNRYYHKTTRNAVRALRATTDPKKAAEMLPVVSAMLDKLAKNNVIHKNKASNLKSSLAIYIAKL